VEILSHEDEEDMEFNDDNFDSRIERERDSDDEREDEYDDEDPFAAIFDDDDIIER
jgi:hypothetical protein